VELEIDDAVIDLATVGFRTVTSTAATTDSGSS
jgi:hypothetical protein